MSESLKLSLEFWNDNPGLVAAYMKALSDEFKKPVDQQRPSHKVALECVQKEKENEKRKSESQCNCTRHP